MAPLCRPALLRRAKRHKVPDIVFDLLVVALGIAGILFMAAYVALCERV